MTYDEAQSRLTDRIDAHPKGESVSEIISDLGLGDLATEAAGGYSRKRGLMLHGLRDTAKVHLYEQMEPPVQVAKMKTREAGVTPFLSPSDREAPEHLYWLERWTHFRTATALGQMYFTGAPAIKKYKEDGEVELGVVKKSSKGIHPLSEKLGREGAHNYIRQSRESHEERPSMHRNVDVLCDGWVRLLDEVGVFEG